VPEQVDSNCLLMYVVTQLHQKAFNPRLKGSADYSVCLLLGYGHGFRPPREPVYHDRAIQLTLGRWHDDEVKVDMY
jgi:hypothetical protein